MWKSVINLTFLTVLAHEPVLMKTILTYNFIIFPLFHAVADELLASEKAEICENLVCDQLDERKVCGTRMEDGQSIYKIFNNECELLLYGCQVDNKDAYGIINIEYCEQTTRNDINDISTEKNCDKCRDDIEPQPVCGMRKDGEGYRIRIFDNECLLLKHNCEINLNFIVTDLFICIHGIKSNVGNETRNVSDENNDNVTKNVFDENNDDIIHEGIENDDRNVMVTKNILDVDNDDVIREGIENGDRSDNVTKNILNGNNDEVIQQGTEKDGEMKNVSDENNDYVIHTGFEKDVRNDYINDFDNNLNIKNLIVVGGSGLDRNNINESIDNFFAATHVFDLPLEEMQPQLNESTRRRLIKFAGPYKLFQPLAMMPRKEHIKEDKEHLPTLSSCFHKCPQKCPDTYAPVCGTPGVGVREPALTFKNHCFMDMAQCKMRWENKSRTAAASTYIESSFLFCMGDTMNTVYRFLPLIRTLQRMGRLKMKGQFHYKLKNMRFFNNYLLKEPKFMG